MGRQELQAQAEDHANFVVTAAAPAWFEELSRWESAQTAIRYALDLIEHDGEDLRNLRFLDRKAALARLLRDMEARILLNEHVARMGRPCSPMRASFALGASFLPVRPVPRLDQSSKTAPTTTGHSITKGA
jgi:hypothetical protein